MTPFADGKNFNRKGMNNFLGDGISAKDLLARFGVHRQGMGGPTTIEIMTMHALSNASMAGIIECVDGKWRKKHV